MATNGDDDNAAWDEIDLGLELDLSDDSESLASLETDDGQDHPPETILAERLHQRGFVWYLVKWKDCSVLRSSWERVHSFADCKWLLLEWEVRKEQEESGVKPKFDLDKFRKGIRDLERKERSRRLLRRLKRRIVRVKAIIEAA